MVSFKKLKVTENLPSKKHIPITHKNMAYTSPVRTTNNFLNY